MKPPPHLLLPRPALFGLDPVNSSSANVGRSGASVSVMRALFAEVERPDFVDMRTHAWARADRFAWGEDDGYPIAAPYVPDLVSARRQVFDPPGIIHGDLTGNVLFDSALPPAVIDLTV
jgi:hypothetical protein